MIDRTFISVLDRFVAEYDGLLIDFDGTQILSEDIHAEIGARIMSSHGVPTSKVERYHMRGMGESGIWDDCAAKGTPLSLKKEDFVRLQKEDFSQWLEDFFANKSLQECDALVRPGVVDLMAAFHRAGKKVVTVSNSPADLVLRGTNSTSLKHYVDAYISSDQLVQHGLKPKPSPEGYHLAVQGFSKVDARFLIVEDSLAGVEAAFHVQKAGVMCDIMEIYYDDLGVNPDPRCQFVVSNTGSLLDVFKNCSNENILPQKRQIAGNFLISPRFC